MLRKINFELSSKQQTDLETWMKTLPSAPEGAVGGRFEYILIPNNIGEVLKVRDVVSQKEIDLTDYGTW